MPEWNRLSDIRISDLDANSTRFDEASAGAPDDILQKQWTGTAILSFIVALLTFLLLVSILRVKRVREKSFNCYLLAVVFPDFVYSFSCFVTCGTNSYASRYYSEAMCGWQTWYLVFGFAASCWMNAVIVHQVCTLLKVSHLRGRYDPPTRKKVALQAACVYLYASFVASISTWNIPGLPFKSGMYQGFFCFPKDYDNASTIFFWVAFIPAVVLIPLGYCLFCIIGIYRNGMVPPRGQRRTLGLYLSLIFVFVAMWLPFIVITFVVASASPGPDSTWVLWFGAQFSHMQGLASVCAILLKPDIKNCFLGTVTLGWWDHNIEQGEESADGGQHQGRFCCSKSSMQEGSAEQEGKKEANAGTAERTDHSSAHTHIVPNRISRLGSDPFAFESISEILGDESQIRRCNDTAEEAGGRNKEVPIEQELNNESDIFHENGTRSKFPGMVADPFEIRQSSMNPPGNDLEIQNYRADKVNTAHDSLEVISEYPSSDLS